MTPGINPNSAECSQKLFPISKDTKVCSYLLTIKGKLLYFMKSDHSKYACNLFFSQKRLFSYNPFVSGISLTHIVRDWQIWLPQKKFERDCFYV